MSDRFYQLEFNRDIVPQDFGNIMQIAGMVFQGKSKSIISLLPSATPFHIISSNIDVLQLSAEEWSAILQYSDDPQFFGPDKAWHRKARHIVSGEIQQKVWARDKFTCQYCGRKMGDVLLTIDHWIPLELGGANDTTNYISACRACNKRKGNRHPKEYCFAMDIEHLYNDLDAIAHSGIERGVSRPRVWVDARIL